MFEMVKQREKEVRIAGIVFIMRSGQVVAALFSFGGLMMGTSSALYRHGHVARFLCLARIEPPHS